MTDIQVRSEPLTYSRHNPTRSFFADMLAWRASRPGADQALARLQRHQQELRVAPGRTAGAGGNFAVPLWLNEAFATAPRAGRVLADLIPNFPLPDGASTVNLPRLTTGTTETPQSDNQAVSETDVVDAAVLAGVATIAGQADFPLQSLEQSPAGAALDWAIVKDLTEAYDQQLESQLIAGIGGSGANAQILGVTNVAGINTVTYTDAAPTLSLMFPSFGKATAVIGKTRKKPPECWLMTTSRWSWIATSEDAQGRPITPPDTSDVTLTPPDGPLAVGSLSGRWPVYLDDVIPTNLGTTANQDQVIAIRPSDMMLLESNPFTNVLPELLSGTLQVRFTMRGYASALTGRYPSGITVLGGSGFVVQAGF